MEELTIALDMLHQLSIVLEVEEAIQVVAEIMQHQVAQLEVVIKQDLLMSVHQD